MSSDKDSNILLNPDAILDIEDLNKENTKDEFGFSELGN